MESFFFSYFFFYSIFYSSDQWRSFEGKAEKNMKKRSHPRDYSLVASREGIVERCITLNVHYRINECILHSFLYMLGKTSIYGYHQWITKRTSERISGSQHAIMVHRMTKDINKIVTTLKSQGAREPQAWLNVASVYTSSKVSLRSGNNSITTLHHHTVSWWQWWNTETRNLKINRRKGKKCGEKFLVPEQMASWTLKRVSTH